MSSLQGFLDQDPCKVLRGLAHPKALRRGEPFTGRLACTRYSFSELIVFDRQLHM